ncbi:DUF6053 domain-containing protein [Lysobacter enzymogenes]|uniref:DUF6053 domain-containing protein n=1 Tax=Lysobacter enzymogenes TaxID=69 RepID=UPI003749D101
MGGPSGPMLLYPIAAIRPKSTAPEGFPTKAGGAVAPGRLFQNAPRTAELPADPARSPQFTAVAGPPFGRRLLNARPRPP